MVVNTLGRYFARRFVIASLGVFFGLFVLLVFVDRMKARTGDERSFKKNAEAIAAVPGIDSLLVGSSDLSVELGIPGQNGHEKIQAAVDKVVAACKKHIHPHQGAISADGKFSWVEMECLGACVNAPILQVNDDFFEDMDAGSVEKLLEALQGADMVFVTTGLDVQLELGLVDLELAVTRVHDLDHVGVCLGDQR